MNNSMINPSIVDLLKKVDNRYTLVTITAKRARQLIQDSEPLVDVDSTKPVTIAINEIDQDLITYETVKEGIK
ncbi:MULTISPECIES: DNA-directed RNA polymerase subunit omega [Clostridium]|jgi:DNA-directed RNA polymerase subunit omega|uniref:DNA-directed RNA polymerase subunit omega n=6 Tax=Clostridium TaxID=1485 RepID=A0A168L670_9CLOT|nr:MULTISPECIES: DNA-directed RNA polymerase subunit omega [Clostridium]ADK14321.1 DNA-directed RNA polymerase omega chain [Clostridium ljungdahlii DSM 13528]AGY77538.1 DNA-directed RNA polymerase subunit omega [Clostridium autoethanogenum DSM 10061]ALU37679.1 DNA-directed RNA polymerase subunit omega [Clostridium autoethanogenum DSM 10061]OAA82717.1 DNA-directed RNA polymerase subunit omega [Clostridium ljungdahlii]OAA88258.1 DNA-directed RNA polymerase subunit omega [Clostridium ljungdahlii 